MSRFLKTLGLTLVAAVALTVILPTAAQAQIVIVHSAPVMVPGPIVTNYAPPTYYAPSISYSAPSYIVPSISYSAPSYVVPSISYSAPVVTYAAPRVSYYSPVVTSYSASIPAGVVVTPSPGLYTTYTYRNGLGIFRPRYVNQTYYTPLP